MSAHSSDGDLAVTTEFERNQEFAVFSIDIFPRGSIVEPKDDETIMVTSEAEFVESWWESSDLI